MKKIFHLDDNAELIEITKITLGRDYIIESRSSVENLADELRNFSPDLILIDHFVGDANSTEILKDIQNSIPGFSIPFILYSASFDIEERSKRLGAAGFIEKPSSIRYIKEYIGDFFSGGSKGISG